MATVLSQEVFSRMIEQLYVERGYITPQVLSDEIVSDYNKKPADLKKILDQLEKRKIVEKKGEGYRLAPAIVDLLDNTDDALKNAIFAINGMSQELLETIAEYLDLGKIEPSGVMQMSRFVADTMLDEREMVDIAGELGELRSIAMRTRGTLYGDELHKDYFLIDESKGSVLQARMEFPIVYDSEFDAVIVSDPSLTKFGYKYGVRKISIARFFYYLALLTKAYGEPKTLSEQFAMELQALHMVKNGAALNEIYWFLMHSHPNHRLLAAIHDPHAPYGIAANIKKRCSVNTDSDRILLDEKCIISLYTDLAR